MKMFRTLALATSITAMSVLPAAAQQSETASSWKALIETTSAQRVGAISLDSKEMKSFYAQRNYAPAWLKESGMFSNSEVEFNSKAAAFFNVFISSYEEGLEPSDYYVHVLKDRIEKPGNNQERIRTELLLTKAALKYITDIKSGRIDPSEEQVKFYINVPETNAARHLQAALESSSAEKYLSSLSPKHQEYQILKKELADLRARKQAGKDSMEIPGLKPGQRALRVGARDVDFVPVLRRKLIAEGYLPAENAEVDETVYSTEVQDAVKKYQEAHNLEVDGLVGSGTIEAMNRGLDDRINQVKLSMERWRWLPDDLGQKHIRVNIAGYQAEAFENGREALVMPVIVGREANETPVFSSEMKQVVFHPYWNAPSRLSYEYVLEKIKKNPSVVDRLGYELYHKTGDGMKKISMNSVNLHSLSENDFKTYNYQFRQRPGPANALGPIKFRIENNDNIYMHGTPEQKLFQQNIRAESSGCIRLENPLAMAKYALEGMSEWSDSRIEQEFANKTAKPLHIQLDNPIPVHIFYMTAWVDNYGKVQYYPDIYKRDQQLTRLLQRETQVSRALDDPKVRVATQ